MLSIKTITNSMFAKRRGLGFICMGIFSTKILYICQVLVLKPARTQSPKPLWASILTDTTKLKRYDND